MNFSNPDSTCLFSKWLIGFVDDNILIMKLDNPGFEAPVEQLLEVATKGLGVWKRLIHITGEELELSKCCFSLMTWKLHKGTEVLCTIDEAPGSLSLHVCTLRQNERNGPSCA